MIKNYEVCGPFELPRDQNKRIEKSRNVIRSFWEDTVNFYMEGLSDAIGCYVFALHAGGGGRPWYIGKTVRQTFKTECLQVHKLHKYNEALSKQMGRPMLYFLPKMTSQGRFSKPSQSNSGLKDVDLLEQYLIGQAMKRNHELLNINGKLFGQIFVPGILNQRSKKFSAKKLGDVLGN